MEFRTEHETLRISEDIIIDTAGRLFSTSDLALRVVKQAFYENWLKIGKKVNFRHSDNDAAVRGYSRMNIKQFDGINARQAWANWRTIPRNLSSQLPFRPVRALDLCSGVGDSTRVLAHYLPENSEILGLEFNAYFVSIAQRKKYQHCTGAKAKVTFREQSVLETFRDGEGLEIAAESIDLINCVGAVGHHFVPAQTRVLTAEINRVMRPGGLALIDSGSAGTPKPELVKIFAELGFNPVNGARSCCIDPYEQICFRKMERL